NRTGKLTTNFGANDGAWAVAIQSDGKIVLAGEAGYSFGVARYHPAGDPDENTSTPAYTGFATDGKQTTDFTANVFDGARAVAIQSDGKIVLAGFATNNNGTTSVTTDDHKDFALARYTTTGAPDTGFATDGKQTTDFGGLGRDDQANAMAVQSNGKYVLVGSSDGSYAIARYNTGGALDGEFGIVDQGTNTRPGYSIKKLGSTETKLFAVAIRSDGKIVAAGTSTHDTAPDFIAPLRFTAAGDPEVAFRHNVEDHLDDAGVVIGDSSTRGRAMTLLDDGGIVFGGSINTGSVHEFMLLGVNSNGALNGRFGIGGVVTTGFSGSGVSRDEARAVAIDSNGKIVVAGHTPNDTALARYNSNGALDTGFGTGGRVISSLSSATDLARAMAFQSDGKIVVAGYANNGTDDDIAVARYNANGSPDTGFGTGGKTLSGLSGKDRAYAMALLDDGKILVAGEAGGNFILKRFNADGSADTGFQTAGKVTTHMGGSDDVAYAMAVQPDGKIVLAGRASNGTNNDFALARYTAAGDLDTTFSDDGKVLTDFNSANDLAVAVAIQPDGKIVVAGRARNGSRDEFALVRYNADGTPDTGFGTGGKVTTPVGDASTGVGDSINAMELQANGKIIVAGYAKSSGAIVFALARYHVNGTLDTGFDAGGTGKALTGIGHRDDRAYALALQPDGKMVAVGPSYDGAHNDFAVARYLGEEPVSTDATLLGLSLSASADGSTFDRAARLKPAFAPGTTAYTAFVQDDVTHVQVTPTANDARATITVNGQTATSGGASGAIAVTPGTTTLTVVVTAADGATTQTYTVSFVAISTDATLSGLSVSASADGSTFDRAPSLSPSFSSGAVSYAVTVREDVSHVKVTPTTSDAGATVTVNSATVTSGSASHAIAVSDGSTVIVTVTAGDEVNTETYVVTLNFEYDATLSALAVSASADGATFAAAELRPDFSPGTTSYRAVVENDNTHVKVTPTTTISGATVTVNGQAVTSGSASAAIAASQGDSVTVVVTGTDGSTTVTYTLELAPRARGIRLYPEGPTTVLEGESVRFWVSPPPLDRNVSIPVTVTAGTAESGDYQELTTVATVASQQGGTGVIRTYHDADQDDETFTVSLDESMVVALGLIVDRPNSVTFTIRDDDKPSPVTISVAPDPVRKGEEGQMREGGAAQIAVVIAESKSQNVSIPITVTSSSGESGDYSAPSSIVIRRGETVGTGALRALQDADAVDEILTVSLGSNLPALATAGTPSSAQITIRDDDSSSQVFIKRIEPDPVPEGGTAYVVLGITPTQPGRVTIPVTFTHLTSEAGDFRLPTSITFDAGQPEAVGELRALQDSDADDERLNVELGGNLPDLVTAGSPSVREVTIEDDEAAFEVIIKRIEANPVREGETAHVVLGISPAQPGRVTIPVTFTHGSSESGDFRLPSSITFDAGQPEAVGEFQALQDSDSDDETFTVSLGSSLPALATAGTPSSMQVTIDDDEFVSRVWFKRVEPGGVPEGETAYVVLGIEPAQPERVTIPVTITHVSSEAGDFGSLSSITFDAGQPEAVGELRTRQDSDEDDEVLEVALGSSLPALVTAGTPASIRVTIKDDDGSGSGGGGGGGGGNNDAAPQHQPLPRVERGNASLEVTWIIKDDHSPYTGFDVEYRQKGTAGWTDAGHSGTARAHTISGLTNGTTYQVRVRAKIGSAEGPWSWQIAEGTPVAPPGAPMGLTVSAANRQQTLDVSWTAPSGEVTGYRVEYREAGSQEWLRDSAGRKTSIRIWNLKDGTTYNVRVRALID
ncbi:MAG: cadherin-like beta sandwich domain-containing protein, partial [Chloroflexi bacterium]|nr:cadherin-like beta sandwich domain-containing protein [Chloroflexota bacterium]